MTAKKFLVLLTLGRALCFITALQDLQTRQRIQHESFVTYEQLPAEAMKL